MEIPHSLRNYDAGTSGVGDLEQCLTGVAGQVISLWGSSA